MATSTSITEKTRVKVKEPKRYRLLCIMMILPQWSLLYLF